MKKLGVLIVLFLSSASSAHAASYPLRFPAVTAVVTQLAGHPADVICEVPQEWVADTNAVPYSYGYTIIGSHAVLGPYSCGGVALLAADPNSKLIKGYESRKGEGLLVLMHELGHLLTGSLDEGLVECNALHAVPAAARMFGANPANVRELTAAATILHNSLPPVYRTVC